MEKDTGGWLSAQQAVLPDGTELTNLPLVNKKLPALVRAQDTLESSDLKRPDFAAEDGSGKP